MDTTQVITSPLESEAALFHACSVTVLHGWPRVLEVKPLGSVDH